MPVSWNSATRASWNGATNRKVVLLYGDRLLCCVDRAKRRAANNALYAAAMESITADELYHYVEVLADDIYEGRASGSRGGHAAAQWLIQQLRPFQLTPAGAERRLCAEVRRRLSQHSRAAARR